MIGIAASLLCDVTGITNAGKKEAIFQQRQTDGRFYLFKRPRINLIAPTHSSVTIQDYQHTDTPADQYNYVPVRILKIPLRYQSAVPLTLLM